MTTLSDAARFLGLEKSAHPHGTDMDFLGLLDSGLPVRSLEAISTRVAPRDSAFKYRIVPKASLARSKSSRRLSTNHSIVVTRLASVWALALRIWKTEENVRAFLYRAHPLLGQRLPIDLILENEIGSDLVKSILGRLENGSAV